MRTLHATYTSIQHLLKLQRILYNLPFTALGALLPFLGKTSPPRDDVSWQLLAWMALAFFSARNSGMAFNELLDSDFDKKNPRTQHRVIPSGRLTPTTAKILAWSFLALFLFACWQISPLCALLAVPTAALIYLYSYAKRFTASCHLILGAIQMLGPLMAFIAITQTLAWPPAALSLGVLSLLTGTDILYAIQDIEFDRKEGLFSIPAILGKKRATIIGKILHALALLAFLSIAPAIPSPPIYITGIILTAPLLFLTNTKVKTPRCNTLVALTLTISTLGALLWHASS